MDLPPHPTLPRPTQPYPIRCQVLKAVGLEEYMALFVEHRVQGDVIFNLTEENLKEMGELGAAPTATTPTSHNLPTQPQRDR